MSKFLILSVHGLDVHMEKDSVLVEAETPEEAVRTATGFKGPCLIEPFMSTPVDGVWMATGQDKNEKDTRFSDLSVIVIKR